MGGVRDVGWVHEIFYFESVVWFSISMARIAFNWSVDSPFMLPEFRGLEIKIIAFHVTVYIGIYILLSSFDAS